jgi:hypothetical protein
VFHSETHVSGVLQALLPTRNEEERKEWDSEREETICHLFLTSIIMFFFFFFSLLGNKNFVCK